MDSSSENQLIQSIYDRIYNLVTYSPSGSQVPVFNAQTTFVQIVPLGLPVSPADLANAASPINPGGSLTAAEMFSRLVDPIPALSADYTPTTNTVSGIYGEIVGSADASEEPSDQAVSQYNQAYNFLNQTTTITDYTGAQTTQVQPTAIYANYQQNQLAYLSALAAYQTAMGNYDLTNPQQQRQWQANSPLLQAAVTQAWNTWRGQGAAQVEQALGVINTTVNSAVRTILTNAQQAFTQSVLQPQLTGDTQWHLSYAMPTTWADATVNNLYAQFQLSSSNLQTNSSSNYTSYGGGGAFSNGLWSVGGSFQHSTGSQSQQTQASNVQISMDVAVVEIMRPWLNGSIFGMSGWNMGAAFPPGAISTGSLSTATAQTVMPLIPTAFVAARNVQITGDWGEQDMQAIQSATSGSASVGWGPFQISGSYSSSSSQSSFSSTFQNGTITIPGLQIIAFVSQVLPEVPPAS
jgi:hypothetical protein